MPASLRLFENYILLLPNIGAGNSSNEVQLATL